MFIGSFIVQFFLMSTIMTNKMENITNSLGKVYLSIIMGLYMMGIEIMMHDHHYGVFSMKYYVFIGILLGLFIYLYRTQKYITDKQYLEEMIEHHSMALLTSEEILQKTQSERIKKLAENIISTQEKEIEYMRQLIAING
jgi:uncharacterized protein (DUF305 family)